MEPEFDQCLAILYNALETKGLAVATTNPIQAKAALESAKAKDAALTGLRITFSKTSPNSEVWIVNDQLESPNATKPE